MTKHEYIFLFHHRLALLFADTLPQRGVCNGALVPGVQPKPKFLTHLDGIESRLYPLALEYVIFQHKDHVSAGTQGIHSLSIDASHRRQVAFPPEMADLLGMRTIVEYGCSGGSSIGRLQELLPAFAAIEKQSLVEFIGKHSSPRCCGSHLISIGR